LHPKKKHNLILLGSKYTVLSVTTIFDILNELRGDILQNDAVSVHNCNIFA
jgi:hypothetical protein